MIHHQNYIVHHLLHSYAHCSPPLFPGCRIERERERFRAAFSVSKERNTPQGVFLLRLRGVMDRFRWATGTQLYIYIYNTTMPMWIQSQRVQCFCLFFFSPRETGCDIKSTKLRGCNGCVALHCAEDQAVKRAQQPRWKIDNRKMTSSLICCGAEWGQSATLWKVLAEEMHRVLKWSNQQHTIKRFFFKHTSEYFHPILYLVVREMEKLEWRSDFSRWNQVLAQILHFHCFPRAFIMTNSAAAFATKNHHLNFLDTQVKDKY